MQKRSFDYLPPPLRWRAIVWSQHLRMLLLKRIDPAPTLAGIKIPVTRELSDNLCAAIYDGYYESAELRAFSKHLTDDDIILEVGAGIGFLSAYCATAIGSDRVFAYEANPKMEPLIRSVYVANNVTPHLRIGVLGNDEGKVDFFVTEDFWASSLIRPSLPCETVPVPVYSLNDEVRRITPTFLIMDIEGGEFELLSSIEFGTIRKISCELHTDVLGQDKVERMKRIMHQAGFRIHANFSVAIPGVKEILFLER